MSQKPADDVRCAASLRTFPGSEVRRLTWVLPLLATALLGACACNDFRRCAAPSPQQLAQLPQRLSETGLYADQATGTLAPGVRAFAPRYALWSDGASKRRWVLLPPGERIDTRDMDSWQFPQGTRLWKEFTRDGVRVETRLLQKVGPEEGDWAAVAYVWNPEQTAAEATPAGAADANGTPHDVPSASECMGCHGGTRSRVLGFSAIQLAYDAPAGMLDLQGLLSEGALTAPPEGPLAVPGNETERAALGYLHANCGHCHNQRRPEQNGARCFAPQNELDFWLRVDRLGSVQETPTYQSAVGSGGPIEPGNPDDSRLIHRVSTRDDASMPPLGTEVVDTRTVELLRRWMQQL